MDRRRDGKPATQGRMIEAFAWAGCLLAAVMPTAVLASIAQSLDRAKWALFAPLLYILVFTLMVIVIRPWTHR